MLSKFLDPKTDVVFKHLFGKDKNKEILKYFINDLLGLSGDNVIDQIEFQQSEKTGDGFKAKKIILDIICKDVSGRFFIVEMQMRDVYDFAKRTQYYSATVYSNQLAQAAKYGNLKPVYLIAIVNESFLYGLESYISKHSILEENTYINYLKDLKFVFMELPKFNKQIHELETNSDRWAYFLKHAENISEEELEILIKSYPIMLKAFNQLEEKNLSRKELEVYNRAKIEEMDRISHEEKMAEKKRKEKAVLNAIKNEVKALAARKKEDEKEMKALAARKKENENEVNALAVRKKEDEKEMKALAVRKKEEEKKVKAVEERLRLAEEKLKQIEKELSKKK